MKPMIAAGLLCAGLFAATSVAAPPALDVTTHAHRVPVPQVETPLVKMRLVAHAQGSGYVRVSSIVAPKRDLLPLVVRFRLPACAELVGGERQAPVFGAKAGTAHVRSITVRTSDPNCVLAADLRPAVAGRVAAGLEFTGERLAQVSTR